MIKIQLDSSSAVLSFHLSIRKNPRWLDDECWGLLWADDPQQDSKDASTSGDDKRETLLRLCSCIKSSTCLLVQSQCGGCVFGATRFTSSHPPTNSPRPQSHCPLAWWLNIWWTTWACLQSASWGFPPGPSLRRRSQITATPALDGTDTTKALRPKHHWKRKNNQMMTERSI